MQIHTCICQKSYRKADSFIVCLSPSFCSKHFRRKILFFLLQKHPDCLRGPPKLTYWGPG